MEPRLREKVAPGSEPGRGAGCLSKQYPDIRDGLRASWWVCRGKRTYKGELGEVGCRLYFRMQPEGRESCRGKTGRSRALFAFTESLSEARVRLVCIGAQTHIVSTVLCQESSKSEKCLKMAHTHLRVWTLSLQRTHGKGVSD